MNRIDYPPLGSDVVAWLPEMIFDAHVHFTSPVGNSVSRRDFRHKFPAGFGMAEYRAMAKQIMTEVTVKAAGFGMPEVGCDIDAAAQLTGDMVEPGTIYGLSLVAPNECASAVETRLRRYHLCGLKPYMDLIPGYHGQEVELFEMLSPELLEMANDLQLAITLHLPRAGRLADPVNIAQLTLWLRRYPRVKFIVAHLGRAYYYRVIAEVIDHFSGYENCYFDSAMINNVAVLHYAFTHIPVDRLIFGTDAPIALLLGKALEINDQYCYLMGEDYAIGTSVDGRTYPVKFNTFYGEQLHGCYLASGMAQWSRDNINSFMGHNSERIFEEATAWLK